MKNEKYKEGDLVICQGRKCICAENENNGKVLIVILAGEKPFGSDFRETNMKRTMAKNLKKIKEVAKK